MNEEYMKDFDGIRKKLLNIVSADQLPEGAWSRMMRDNWCLAKKLGNNNQSFEEYKKDWEAKYDEDCRIRDIEHPIEFNKTVRIDKYKTVQFFKRKGEEWMCSECDMAPNGGSGSVSLDEALRMVGKKDISEI